MPYSFRVNFPEQTARGDYAITVGSQVQDLYGQALSQVYTSAFTIAWALRTARVENLVLAPLT